MQPVLARPCCCQTASNPKSPAGYAGPAAVVATLDGLSLQELGTSGNLDGQQRLIVKGRFLPKGFENVIRRYMNEYVLCASCKSPDTLLDRDAGAAAAWEEVPPDSIGFSMQAGKQQRFKCIICVPPGHPVDQLYVPARKRPMPVDCLWLQARASCSCGASSAAHPGP